MQFSNIVTFTQDRFETLRKPNGKPYNYTSGNLKRSIMCSLTSNGVFQKVAQPTTLMSDSRVSQTSHTSSGVRDINKELWKVCEDRAIEYFDELQTKLDGQK
jgi:hypothetical protein